MRAEEQSPGERPPPGPLEKDGPARVAAAGLFDRVLAERWARGDDSVSNRAIADRFLRVTEKQVRQYRDARKHVPIAALYALPLELVEELVRRLLEERRGAAGRNRRGFIVLREGARLVRESLRSLSTEERVEALRSLLALQRELADVVAELAQEVR